MQLFNKLFYNIIQRKLKEMHTTKNISRSVYRMEKYMVITFNNFIIVL